MDERPQELSSRVIDRASLDPQVRWVGPEVERERARAAATNRREVVRDDRGLTVPARSQGAAYVSI